MANYAVPSAAPRPALSRRGEAPAPQPLPLDALPNKKRRSGALRQIKRAQLDPKGGTISKEVYHSWPKKYSFF